VTTAPDIVLVLGAALHPDGTPKASLIRRARHAAALALDHGAVLICSGGAVTSRRTEADAMADIAKAAGLAPRHILHEDRSRNTWENLSHARALIPDGATVWIVTDPWHAPRVALVARRQRLRARVVPTWGREPRVPALQAARFWVRELAALIVYAVRHR